MPFWVCGGFYIRGEVNLNQVQQRRNEAAAAAEVKIVYFSTLTDDHDGDVSNFLCFQHVITVQGLWTKNVHLFVSLTHDRRAREICTFTHLQRPPQV